jgi:hypothetical protein
MKKHLPFLIVAAVGIAGVCYYVRSRPGLPTNWGTLSLVQKFQYLAQLRRANRIPGTEYQ